MKEILDKFSSYNIFNYLFPGVLFAIFSTYFYQVDFIQKDIISGLFFYYFLGLVISRIGSLIVEPLLKKVKFITYVSYKDYLKAPKENTKLEILSEVNNMYRTLIALFLTLLLFKFFLYLKESIYWLEENVDIVAILFLLFLFLFSYKKQTKYIVKQIKSLKDE